jgi:hypothetical protein
MMVEIHTITSHDDEHEGHHVEVEETIWDNPVEFTKWVRCHDCGVTFIEESCTMIVEQDHSLSSILVDATEPSTASETALRDAAGLPSDPKDDWDHDRDPRTPAA